jgi:exonuclease III
LITGDFNYGPKSSDLHRYNKIQELIDNGWNDACRHYYGPQATPERWTHKNKAYRKNKESGFSLVDHFFVSDTLLSKIHSSPINDQSVLITTTKGQGCSDHSLLSLKICRKP